jgi:hypothetical protein
LSKNPAGGWWVSAGPAADEGEPNCSSRGMPPRTKAADRWLASESGDGVSMAACFFCCCCTTWELVALNAVAPRKNV